jgi:hypothetical protein
MPSTPANPHGTLGLPSAVDAPRVGPAGAKSQIGVAEPTKAGIPTGRADRDATHERAKRCPARTPPPQYQIHFL